MAESLKRLVNISTFNILQEKLERWLDDYYINSCDQNTARCCEIIELNARVQSQLFKLLALAASEGGIYGGAGVIKSRLLPLLGRANGLPSDDALTSLAQISAKDREINGLQEVYERSLDSLEKDLLLTNTQALQLKHDLEVTRDELESTKRQSVSEKMFTEAEAQDMRTRIDSMEEELSLLRSRSSLVDSYERQVRRLKDDLDLIDRHRPRDVYMNGSLDSHSVLPVIYKSRSRAASPVSLDVTQKVRQQNLVSHFNDMFAQDRLDAMDILRVYSSDHQNNQKIVFNVIQEAFANAKLAFASHKLKVRSTLALTHRGPGSLDEAVQDYINRNSDLFDLPGLVADVIRTLNRNPSLYLPPDVSYNVIYSYIRECCKFAWNCSALSQPLDVAVASNAELFDDKKYRRSYDSEYTAALVNHHVWPCLLQGYRVVAKGEACTRRGALLSGSRPVSRPGSPFRSLTSPGPRSRSPSPRRADSNLGRRSPSRAYSPGRSPSRAITPSTSLSNYGVQS